MKQVLRRGFGQIVIDEVPDPMAPPHHVLVRPHYSLISSGTETANIHPDVLKVVAHNPSHLRTVLDTAVAQGPLATYREIKARFSSYAVLGYSGAGIVAGKHATVTDVEAGQRVAYGGEGTGHGETIVTGRNLVARVPDGVPLDDAAFSTLGAIAMNSIRAASVGIGDVVAVIGLGLVGQLVAQLARVQGAVVIGVDLKPERAKLAAELGADHVIAGEGAKEGVLGLTDGRGADCVIIAAAAKSAAPCQLALEMCRDRGRIVVVGAVEMQFPWLQMYLKEIQLFMSRAYGPGSYDPAYENHGHDYPISYVRWTENRNMEEFLRLLERGAVRVAPLVTHRFGLEEAPKAYETIMEASANSLAVVLRYPQAEAAAVPAFVRRVDTQDAAKKAKLNLALVGAAGIARWAHMPVVQKMPELALRAVYSSSGARGRSLALRYKAAYCTSDYNELIEDAETDAVLIVSRNQHHARQTIGALRAGKHVFVEKPMALTIEECRDIVRAVHETGRHLTVGFNRRFAPLYLELMRKTKMRSGPVVINCRVNSPSISGPFWMADPAIGGAILGEACHFVDLMYWLLDSEPVAVSAWSLPTGKQEPIGENNVAASFRFADGSVGNLTYCTVGSKTSGGERVEVFGPGFGVVTEDFRRFSAKGNTERSKSRLFADKGYEAQMRAFASAILDGGAQQVSVRDGVRATLGCLAILEAARTGEAVAIDTDAVMDVAQEAQTG